MLQKSHRFRTSIWAAALLFGLPGAASAQPATPAPLTASFAAPAVTGPSNTVHCVHDLLSFEDREMALLLFEREVASDAKFHGNSRNLKVIDRLVDEARAKCSAPAGWSSGRTDAAISYAMSALMSTGLTQALEAKGRSAALIDAYYTRHRAELAGTATIEGPHAEEFRAYLFEQGWSKSETSTLKIAEFYLEGLFARARLTTTFAAAAAHPATAARRAKPTRQPGRVRTTRRGTP